jgi:hypothetical protein
LGCLLRRGKDGRYLLADLVIGLIGRFGLIASPACGPDHAFAGFAHDDPRSRLLRLVRVEEPPHEIVVHPESFR